ncbi:unnamed protein product [Effrenium voratum]|uniref:Uncharacterized protein n=1 Tax=Effrenium voratum TaxID=2562239 RepID=A0AA36I6F7_9DINO|nr:unnamed protein product [Effrenium voratum]
MADQFSSIYCCADAAPNAAEPPRGGWKLPDEERGLLPVEYFTKGLQSLGVSAEVLQSLMAKVVHKDAEGKEVAFRRREGVTFDEEWGQLSEAPGEAPDAWKAGVAQAQASLMEEFGISGDRRW